VLIAVITVSDRASRGEYRDESGPEIARLCSESWPQAEIVREVVPDGIDSVLGALERHADADWIITTGGTGPSPRDLTPEASAQFCERELPGLSEFFRIRSLEQTPNAVFSRGYCGMKGTTYVVNFPGSVKAASFHAALLCPLLGHGMDMALGRGH